MVIYFVSVVQWCAADNLWDGHSIAWWSEMIGDRILYLSPAKGSIIINTTITCCWYICAVYLDPLLIWNFTLYIRLLLIWVSFQFKMKPLNFRISIALSMNNRFTFIKYNLWGIHFRNECSYSSWIRGAIKIWNKLWDIYF